jgi:hypothetical protein
MLADARGVLATAQSEMLTVTCDLNLKPGHRPWRMHIEIEIASRTYLSH